MAEYRLPDGRTFSADPANPEHAQWLRQEGAQPVNTLSVPGVVKSVGSGLAEGAARLPFALSDLANFGLDLTKKHLDPEWMRSEGYRDFRAAHKGSGWLDEGLAAAGTGFYQPQPGIEKYLNVGAQGVGGGLASVAPRLAAPVARVLPFAKPTMPAELIRSTAVRAAPVAATAGGAGAVAGEAAQDFTGSDNPLIGLIANTLVGGGVGWKMGRTGRADSELARAGQATSAADWKAAAANLEKFQRAGSTTATLGEAFPGKSPFLGFTKEATAQSGANPLIPRMAQREADLQALANRALDSIGPPVGPTTAANAAEAAAKARLQQFRQARTAEYTKRLEGAPPMPEAEVRGVYDMLQALKKSTSNTNDRAAIDAVAQTLVHPDPKEVTYLVRVKEPNKPARFEERTRTEMRFKTDVGEAARQLKTLKEELEFNPTTSSTPTKLSAHSFRQPYEIVNDFFRQIAPEHYARAEDAFKRYSTNLITPAEKGPLGVMAGRSTAANTQVPITRMEALATKTLPDEIPSVVRSLDKGAPPDGIAAQVTRALLGERVRRGGPNLGDRMMGGAEGSTADAQTRALVRTVGTNTPAFETPVDVLRLLSRIESTADTGGGTQRAREMSTSAGTAIFNPLQEGRTRAGLAARGENYQKAAQLLANPTKENLEKLRELAKSDPGLRLRLGLGGGLSSANTLDE